MALPDTYPGHLENFFNDSSGNNFGGWIDADYQQLAQNMLYADDIWASREAAFDMQAYASEALPYVPLYAFTGTTFYNPTLVALPAPGRLDGIDASQLDNAYKP